MQTRGLREFEVMGDGMLLQTLSYSMYKEFIPIIQRHTGAVIRGLSYRPIASLFFSVLSAGGKNYKEQKESDRRARANDSVGWNASYVRADTVVDALADRLGVGKGDILDREEVSRFRNRRTCVELACFAWGRQLALGVGHAPSPTAVRLAVVSAVARWRRFSVGWAGLKSMARTCPSIVRAVFATTD